MARTYFGAAAHGRLDMVGAEAFKKQLYQCTLAQALGVKSDIEVRRSTNTFGLLTWQLNEIWPTGGWGSLEYGTVGWTAGQVNASRHTPPLLLALGLFPKWLVSPRQPQTCWY